MFLKWLRVPSSHDTRLIEAVQLWEVRWESRSGKYLSDTQKEMEAFTSKQEAEAFATSLKNAFRLIRHTSGDSVSVRRGKSDGGPALQIAS